VTSVDPAGTADRARGPAEPGGAPASSNAAEPGNAAEPCNAAAPGNAPESSAPGPARHLPAERSTRRRYAIMLITAAVVVAVDHLTKWLVSTHVVLDTEVPAGAPITIHYIHNSGAAFGLLPQLDFLYLVVAAIVIGYILLYGPSMGGGMLRLLALGCILGGSLSNGIDRLAQGYVVDFIDFHFWLFQIFNVADMGIVGGMLVIVYQLGIRRESPAPG
jgi:signal peptidase II